MFLVRSSIDVRRRRCGLLPTRKKDARGIFDDYAGYTGESPDISRPELPGVAYEAEEDTLTSSEESEKNQKRGCTVAHDRRR